MAPIDGSPPLLDTKLCPPRLRPDLVRRPQLTARLDAGTAGRLVLVCAPAGFGKTTVVGQWLAEGRARDPEVGVAWLSLDEADGDLARFVAYLVAAVGAAVPPLGDDLLAGLRSPSAPDAEMVLTELINAVARCPHELVLVLDDYHAVSSAPVDRAVEFLVERCPVQLHLVIVGREDPVLPLARWRAAGVLTEVRAADLRFTVAEAATLLSSVMGLDLRGADVGALAERTEGWIAGLQLAGLSLRGRTDAAALITGFTGSHRYVFDYLVEEILARRPEAQRRFLMQTSVLDRMCADLCDAVTGQHDGGEALQRLERENVFVVALDDQRRWYRYHHLFADVLRVRLQAEFPDEVAGLHRRASDWFDAAGMPTEAVSHALAAADLDRAADLLERSGEAVEEAPRAGTWLAQARTLPDELVRARPALCVWLAFALLGTGELEAAGAWLAEAEAGLAGARPDPAALADREPDAGLTGGDRLRSLLGRIAVARAYLAAATGDAPGAADLARHALDLVPPAEVARHDQATALLGMTCLAGGDLQQADLVFTAYGRRLLAAGNCADAIGVGCLLADVRPILGRLRLAEGDLAALHDAVLSRSGEPPAELADLYRAWAELDLARGDAGAAGEHLQRSGQLGQLRAMPVWRYRWHVAAARLQVVRGDRRAALDLLDEAQRLFIRTPMPDLRPIPAMRAGIWAEQGRVGDALSWARERGLSVDDEPDLVHEYEHLTLARVLLADQHRGPEPGEAAVGLLDRLLRAAEDGGRVGSAIEILVVQATAHHGRGRSRAAWVALARALALAEPEGFLQVFLDGGHRVADVLRDAVARGAASGWATAVLAAFPQPGAGHAGMPGAPALSAREVEVLGHIAAGLTNQQIAARLVVSPYTVKAHARSIYDKLDAHSRTAAVARARALGILPSR